MKILILNGSPHLDGPTSDFQSIVEYWGVENAGIFTANGRQNKSEKKRKELYRFGKNL